VRDSGTSWVNTTHDWAATVDHEHLGQIREHPATCAPGGVRHLILGQGGLRDRDPARGRLVDERPV